MSNVWIIYSTAPDAKEATRLARMLLEKELVACVNIMATVQSLYRWQGKIEESQEVVLIAKTTEENVQETIETIKSSHSYTCPCVTAWKIDASNNAYLEYVEQQVRKHD